MLPRWQQPGKGGWSTAQQQKKADAASGASSFRPWGAPPWGGEHSRAAAVGTGSCYSLSNGFAATYGEAESCRQGARMDKGFAPTKEAPREGLVERVSRGCSSVTLLLLQGPFALQSQKIGLEGRLQGFYYPSPCPKAQLNILTPLQGCNPGSGQHIMV